MTSLWLLGSGVYLVISFFHVRYYDRFAWVFGLATYWYGVFNAYLYWGQ